MDNLKENSVISITELEFKDTPFIGHTYEGTVRQRKSRWKTPYTIVKLISMMMIIGVGFGIIEEIGTPKFLHTLFLGLPSYKGVDGGDFVFVIISLVIPTIVFTILFYLIIEPVIFMYEKAYDVDVTDRFPVLESQEFLGRYGIVSPEYLLKVINEMENEMAEEQKDADFQEGIDLEREYALNKLKMLREGRLFK